MKTQWEKIDAAMLKLAPEASILAAEVKDGKCSLEYGLNDNRSYAVGSAFKLYVLGELARQVGSGKATWDEQLAIREDLKSLPSGKMQNEPAGTKHSLSYFADQMISISDNTAADHLITRLGRKQVEDSLTAMGMADASRNIPLLKTRDMFVLKAPKNDVLARSYIAADADGKRAIVDGTVPTTPLSIVDVMDQSKPRFVDEVEWFASTSDMCSAMASLQVTGSKPGMAPVMDALSINPGVSMDPATWTYVGYKGGSEPGVINLTWLVRRADSRWFVLSMTLANPTSAADNTAPAVSLAGDAFELLAQVK
jgi:hypothetical protein